MESYSEKRESISSNKTRVSQEIYSNQLEAVMDELSRTKEQIKKAKENSIRLWLSSRPLIEELDILQIDLQSAKSRSNTSNKVISELESELNSLNETVAKKEEALNISTLISEITRATNKTNEEIEEVKIETDKKRLEKSKLKLVFKLRRQRLRTLKLRLRAIRLESEAFSASAGEAIRYIACSQVDNPTVQLDRDDYSALTSKAKEETSLAEWRVSVAMEQRPAAEESRDLALRRLRDVYYINRSTIKKTEEKITGSIRDNRKFEEEGLRIRRVVSPKSRGELQGSKGNNNKRIVKKHKPTGLFQMTPFLCR